MRETDIFVRSTAGKHLPMRAPPRFVGKRSEDRVRLIRAFCPESISEQLFVTQKGAFHRSSASRSGSDMTRSY
jgi:hypothetical protein